jgi:valyl-tRNA synthetase
VTEAFERFRLQEVALRGYEFFWGELADWYLELVKPRLRADADPATRRAAQATLAEALDTALRLLHPVMPFITETVWQKLPRADGAGEALIVARWPEPRAEWEDDAAERAIEELQQVIGTVRTIRSEYGIQPAARVPLCVVCSGETGAVLQANRRALHDLARVDDLRFSGSEGEIGASAVLRSGTELFIPLAGVIDLDRERARLREELQRVDGLIAGGEKKLANESFVARAPENVVTYEREKVASFREQRGKLADKLAALEGAA